MINILPLLGFQVQITIGWWLLPLLVTIVSFGRVGIWHRRHRGSCHWDLCTDMAIYYLVAAVVSLVAWLVYAVM